MAQSCVYAALILADDDVAVTEEKLKTILKAANVSVEPYWPSLFAKALATTDVKSLITNLSSGVGAAPAAAAAAPAAEAKKEDKKEAKKKDTTTDDDDVCGGLFD